MFNRIELRDGEYMVNRFGSWEPNLCMLFNKEFRNIDSEHDWTVDLPSLDLVEASRLFNYNMTHCTKVVPGDYWVSRKGTKCFRVKEMDSNHSHWLIIQKSKNSRYHQLMGLEDNKKVCHKRIWYTGTKKTREAYFVVPRDFRVAVEFDLAKMYPDNTVVPMRLTDGRWMHKYDYDTYVFNTKPEDWTNGVNLPPSMYFKHVVARWHHTIWTQCGKEDATQWVNEEGALRDKIPVDIYNWYQHVRIIDGRIRVGGMVITYNVPCYNCGCNILVERRFSDENITSVYNCVTGKWDVSVSIEETSAYLIYQHHKEYICDSCEEKERAARIAKLEAQEEEENKEEENKEEENKEEDYEEEDYEEEEISDELVRNMTHLYIYVDDDDKKYGIYAVPHKDRTDIQFIPYYDNYEYFAQYSLEDDCYCMNCDAPIYRHDLLFHCYNCDTVWTQNAHRALPKYKGRYLGWNPDKDEMVYFKPKYWGRWLGYTPDEPLRIEKGSQRYNDFIENLMEYTYTSLKKDL